MTKSKRINKLCIGTANFVKKYGVNKKIQLNQAEIKRMLSLARLNNIKTFDTDNSYRNTEKTIGKFHSENLYLTSKIPKIPNEIHNPKFWINECIRKSPSDLKTKKIFEVISECEKGNKYIKYFLNNEVSQWF